MPARFIAIHALVFAPIFVDNTSIIQHTNHGQVVPYTHFKIVRIVGRRNLHRARTKFPVHIFIRYNGYLLIDQRQYHGFPNQMRIPLILWMHCYSGVPQHGLGAGGRYDNAILSIRRRVTDMPQMAGLVFVLHLRIRKSGLAVWAPIDDAVTFVDQPFFIQPYKHFVDRPAASFIHGEPFSGPIAGGP